MLPNCDWSTICAKCDSARMIFHNKSSNYINLSQGFIDWEDASNTKKKRLRLLFQLFLSTVFCMSSLEIYALFLCYVPKLNQWEIKKKKKKVINCIISTTTLAKTLPLHFRGEMPLGSGITRYVIGDSVMYLFSFLVDDHV